MTYRVSLCCKMNGQTDKQTERQTDRHTIRQTDRHTDDVKQLNPPSD